MCRASVACQGIHSLGLGLSRLDAQFADVEAAAAPPVGPADDGVLLPAHLDHQQVSDVFVSGDEEGQSAVGFERWPAEDDVQILLKSFSTILFLNRSLLAVHWTYTYSTKAMFSVSP